HLFHIEIEIVRARRQLHEVDDRWPERRLGQLQTADLVRRKHTIGASANELGPGILSLGTGDDEQIRPQQPCRQNGEDVVSVGAPRRDEPSRAADAEPPQDFLAARVGLDRQVALIDRLLDSLRLALDDDKRHRLTRELALNDLADAAESADDEM